MKDSGNSLIPGNELEEFGKTCSLSDQAIALVNHQKADWSLAHENYRQLSQVRTKSFRFGNSRIDCQFNPQRVRSSSADTSPEGILLRDCFLCAGNRPVIQKGILFGTDFIILTNPYPIFPFHLTIVHQKHCPQQIEGNLEPFLELTCALEKFTVFYNGPQCGASAPDHLHFQAGVRKYCPLEEALENMDDMHAEILVDRDPVRIFAGESCARRFLILRSENKACLIRWITLIIRLLERGTKNEPMLNLLSWFEKKEWKVLLFPRGMQRPWQYYADDHAKLLISPAAVELGGLVVLPREEDFLKITCRDLRDIYSQVTLSETDFDLLKQKLKNPES